MPADIAEPRSPASSATRQLLNDDGGIIDDLMVTRPPSAERRRPSDLVVNASRKDVDYAHIAEPPAGRA